MRHISTPESSIPDQHQLTEELRTALASTIRQLEDATPTAREAIDDLTHVRDVMRPPPQSYADLPRLDAAICKALESLVTLCACADENELRHTLKILRRIILIDRRNVDPDEERHALSLGVTVRQLWLIAHRAGLLQARKELAERSAQLQDLPPDQPLAISLREHIALLQQYCETQNGYAASVRKELDMLNTQLNQ